MNTLKEKSVLLQFVFLGLALCLLGSRASHAGNSASSGVIRGEPRKTEGAAQRMAERQAREGIELLKSYKHKKALKKLESAAKLSHPDGTAYLGLMHQYGLGGLTADLGLSEVHFERARNLGSIKATGLLALLYQGQESRAHSAEEALLVAQDAGVDISALKIEVASLTQPPAKPKCDQGVNAGDVLDVAGAVLGVVLDIATGLN